MTEQTRRLLLWLTLFSVAMAFLESTVVIYLREILYPGGFHFPLTPIKDNLAYTEVGREAATLVMLFTLALIAGRSAAGRFAWFLYCFAVWDIFYYVFLKVVLDWPASLMTWDILFLIPVTWTGPVLAPLIVSASMILLALVILRFNDPEGYRVKLKSWEWILLITGAILVVLSLTWDYSGYILEHFSFGDLWSIPRHNLLDVALAYVPRRFNWFLFIVAEGTVLAATGIVYRRLRKA